MNLLIPNNSIISQEACNLENLLAKIILKNFHPHTRSSECKYNNLIISTALLQLCITWCTVANVHR